MTRKFLVWATWGVATLAGGLSLGGLMLAEDGKAVFLLGPTSHGHHQIELACTVCHTSPFGGTSALQGACLDCHGEELELAGDSHPKSKFTDPRNAATVDRLDARHCVTCHREHRPAQTGAMGVTLPGDFCVTCHADIGEERPTHTGMAFGTCASVGCHNFHDNRALYEDFLGEHGQGNWLDPSARLLLSNGFRWRHPQWNGVPQTEADRPDPPSEILRLWLGSAHARTGVNCSGCHGEAAVEPATAALARCADCHPEERAGFVAGKHGMRLASGLPAIDPVEAVLPMRAEAPQRTLSCVSCHGPHEVDRQFAAVEACLGCHDSEHVSAYRNSPHAAAWRAERSGAAPPRSGVSCATCHLPRERSQTPGERDLVRVIHNQNHNLRPSEKMIRPVCMGCHSLAFSIDALADPALVRNNFSGRPARHVESIDMAVGRLHQQSEE
jgi:hypothetical protein